ncbi:MAG: TonB-dependent receptor [Bryobacteraceae bacterium]|nr:TonB-dependent receptor [Bryobacteraceae bacterium]
MQRFVRAAMALCACTLYVSAQDYRASILGQVLDQSKAPVPGAVVKATKEDTQVSRESATTSSGNYTVTGLDPGTYSVTVTHAGFQTSRRTGLVLLTNDKLNLPVTLEVGQMNQEITVVGDQELINTSTASRGLVFDSVKVQEIPLNGRQAYMLMRLSPGVMFTQRTFGSTGFSGTRAWDVNGSFTMNGGRTGSNQFLLNGAPISTDGTFNLAPNVEAVQEMKVMVNTYDSQYGRSGGGHVSTTLKSGSNEWHGTLFDFWRNRMLDANTRQNNALGVKRGFRNQHQFGGTIGGPIRKNRDFFFFSFEGWRERVPFPSNVSVPPNEIRNGDFSTFVPAGQTGTIKIFDPLTSQPCIDPAQNCRSGGLFRRQPFPGNRIPASRISPIGQKILSYYPSPNFQAQALVNNFTRPDNLGKYRYEQPMARYDKVLTDNDRINFLFTFQDGAEFRDQTGFDPPAQWGNMNGTVRQDQNYILSYDRTLSPTSLLHVQASYNRFVQNFPDVSDPNFTWDKIGIKNIPQVDTFPSKLMPRVTIGGFRELFGNQYLNQSSRQQANVQGSISQAIGKHSLKYGTEFALLMRHNLASGRSSGQIDFNGDWTREYASIGQGVLDGNAVASALLGYAAGGSINFNDSFFRREPYWGIFIQDDYKVSQKLTLNLGLRYDIQFSLIETHNRLNREWDFTTVQPTSATAIANWNRLRATNTAMPAPPSALVGGMTFAGVGNQPRKVYNADLSNIQPRIGVAYQFLPKTVMRGGFGIFHRTNTQNNLNNGFSLTTSLFGSTTGGQYPAATTDTSGRPVGSGLVGAYSLENPWPDGVLRPLGSSLGVATGVGTAPSWDPPQRVVPRTFQYSYTLERELPGNMVLELSYVGSLTNKEPRGVQVNAMPQQYWDDAQVRPDFYQQRLANPFQGIFPATVGLGTASDTSREQLLRPYPQFTGLTNNLAPWGRVWYNGLQMRFEKRMLGDRNVMGAMTWVMAYTWSKQMEKVLRDNNNLDWRGFVNQVTADDRRHNLTFAGIWDLPFGKGRRFLTDMSRVGQLALGGWTVNTNFIYQSGNPLGAYGAWEFRCGDITAVQQTENQWFFNDRPRFSECWRNLRPLEYRTLERDRFDFLRGQSAPQIDFMISKKFKVNERIGLEFRGEAFNAFNTPLRGDPPSGNPQAADFGVLPVAQLNFPRNVQLGMRIRF